MKLFIMVTAWENKLVPLVSSKQAYEEKQCSEYSLEYFPLISSGERSNRVQLS